MVTWLLIYSVGCAPAMLAVALIAFQGRMANGMQSRAIAGLTVLAGLVWPLLAVAGIQVVGLLTLKAALGLVRGRDEDAVDTIATPVVLSFQPLVPAAA